MSGLFGTTAPLQIDLNLILQIVTLIALIIGYFFKIEKKYKIHGSTMGIAVIFHIISFLAVMGPRFFESYAYLTTATSDTIVQIIWIHVIPGVIALIMGIFLVVAWAIRRSNITGCIRRKRIMDVTIILWLLSLIFGIATYVIGYL